MRILIALLIAAVLSYLLGSFNSSILVVRLLHHKDIRDFGSHNAGLTNTLRCFGKGSALLTLLGDLFKGIIAIHLSRLFAYLLGAGLTEQADLRYISFFAALCAVFGHVYPLYYGFKGGKGVLVAASAMLAIDWRVALILIAVFAVVLAVSRYVSLSSITAAALLPVVTFIFTLMGRYPLWYNCILTGLALVMGGWIIFMHRSNIDRLRSGTENKFSFHSKSTGEEQKNG